jgi:hypothetical protein
VRESACSALAMMVSFAAGGCRDRAQWNVDNGVL